MERPIIFIGHSLGGLVIEDVSKTLLPLVLIYLIPRFVDLAC
jgi:surfactin synthase thioesterase subunit